MENLKFLTLPGLELRRLGRPAEGSCGNVNVPSDSMKCGEILRQLHDYQLLSNVTAQSSQLLNDNLETV
jgi:hypothetical protein